MKIAVLGTGVVGQTIAGALASLGHDVSVGTRDVDALMNKTEPLQTGGPSFADWLQGNPNVAPARFADAAAHGELVFNATSGLGSIAALSEAGADALGSKVLIDISNPLDFSRGFPPTLSVANDTSLGEQIQDAFPEAKVVKTLNTVNALVMVDPGSVAGGEHDMFLAGNDADAKQTVTEILTGWFGWRHVTDLGDITNARGLEMYLPLWVRLYGSLGSGAFNIRVVR